MGGIKPYHRGNDKADALSSIYFFNNPLLTGLVGHSIIRIRIFGDKTGTVMATFEQRASGWWQAKIRRKGQPVQSQTFEKRIDAEAWARDIENKMDRGVFTDRSEAESTTLRAALERYEREISIHKDGYVQEKKRISKWIRDPLAVRSLANLRSSDFADWQDERLKNVTPSTIQKDRAYPVVSPPATCSRWAIGENRVVHRLAL